MAEKITIEKVRQIAIDRGGKCLSNEYIDNRTKMEFECNIFKHKWFTTYSKIKNGHWCPQCYYESKKLKIEDVENIVNSYGLKLITKEYTGYKSTIECKCEKGHICRTSLPRLKRGHLCLECSYDAKRSSIEELQELAKSRGGKLLNTEYKNAATKYKWQCSEKHVWYATFNSVKSGESWCPECSKVKARLDIKEIQDLAKANGGKLLSTEYENVRQHLYWECSKKHVWMATAAMIKFCQSWCPECHIESLKLKIEDVRKLVEERGGKLLSDVYENYYSKLSCLCENQHNFFITASSLKNNCWCYICSVSNKLGSRSEVICREYFEQIFDKKFIKVRPDWLRSPKTNKLLEIDGYCEELGIAFEHNGVSHYRDIYSSGKLEYTQYKDNYKLEICELRSIKLVVIPQIGSMVKVENLFDFIKMECKKLKIKFPKNKENIKHELNSRYATG